MMILISLMNTDLMIKLVIPLFIISFLLLAFVPIFGHEVKGAKRWLDLYLFRLQPIEILKPLFVLITVKSITNKILKIHN